ncbi:MAG: polysaccharide ABC transporter ATP-binding protein [Acidobacteria bacterium]|nr:polysaccharide ABC transporter ATP-binding protein [Acidobacteriota bacterium]
MSDIAIRVDRLSKQYRMCDTRDSHRTLRDTLTHMAWGPIRALRSVAGNKSVSTNGHKSFWALKDVSFQVRRGEVVGVIGPNGAGKSTLLKILSRITEPSQGYVDIAGRVGSLLEVGTGFHPELTGRENTYLNGAILGMKRSEIDSKFDEIVAFAEIEPFIDTPVKHYSSGMYLRLAFAVAAHLEPEILIVDEVLAVGDAAFQKKCLGKMGEVAGQGRTVLFVSHNMGVISNLCRTCVCLERGRVVDSGSTADVIAGYLARTSAEIPNDGFADLRDFPRSKTLADRHAQFDWVRTLNARGEQTGTFLEREPVRVELGLSLTKPVPVLQMACGVTTTDIQADLIMEPSPELHGSFQPGSYKIQFIMDPIYLRGGYYRLTVKLFANGTRQDTAPEALEICVVSRLAPTDLSTYNQRWINGKFRFDYTWGYLVPESAGSSQQRPERQCNSTSDAHV